MGHRRERSHSSVALSADTHRTNSIVASAGRIKGPRSCGIVWPAAPYERKAQPPDSAVAIRRERAPPTMDIYAGKNKNDSSHGHLTKVAQRCNMCGRKTKRSLDNREDARDFRCPSSYIDARQTSERSVTKELEMSAQRSSHYSERGEPKTQSHSFLPTVHEPGNVSLAKHTVCVSCVLRRRLLLPACRLRHGCGGIRRIDSEKQGHSAELSNNNNNYNNYNDDEFTSASDQHNKHDSPRDHDLSDCAPQKMAQAR